MDENGVEPLVFAVVPSAFMVPFKKCISMVLKCRGLSSSWSCDYAHEQPSPLSRLIPFSHKVCAILFHVHLFFYLLIEI